MRSRFQRGPATETTLVQDDVPEPPVVEEEVEEPPPPPPPRGRPPVLWPWLLLLLVLVAAGIVALWLFTRGNDHKGAGNVTVPNVIGQKQGPAQVAVPDVVGDKAPAAIRRLRTQGLSAQTVSVNSTKPAGVVISQSPAAGASVAKGSTVAIRVPQGPTRVPSVLGQTRASAMSALRAEGLVPKAFVLPSSQPKNTVLAQRPRAGASVPRGTKVRLNVSSGIPPAGGVPPPPPPAAPVSKSVPDVSGQPQSGAQRRLNAVGFKSRVVFVPSDQPEGTVVSQSPGGGTTAKAGTRITLNASLGPNPGAAQAVPKVIGLDPQTATARLEAAGFDVQRLMQKTSVRSLSGKIADVQPARGVHVPAGETVTIYIGRFVS